MMTANRAGGIKVMWDKDQVDLPNKVFLMQMSTVLSNNGQL